ncbi:MAG TPA: hypothetical protein VF179_26795 [Thermoanaerobaculia bacterium]|nr:hypothetical protein [Thermoanaerobaculia bacterium]
MQDSMKVPALREDEDLRADTLSPRSGRLPRARTLVALALLVFAVGFIQLYPTFRTAYAYDDLDCLNLAADVLAGKVGYWEAVFRPHNEHFLPLMRVAFHASAAWFGTDPVPFRLAIFGAHVATAWFLGLLALRYSGRAAAALAAGLVYVLPIGFSSMMLWAITAAGVPIGLVGLSGALLALAHRETLGVRRARLLAGAGCLMALLSGSGLMPLLAGPLLLDEYERRRAGARRWSLGPFAVFCLAAMAATALATAAVYARLHGHTPSLNVLQGLPRAGFLLAITPYRYVLPGLGLPLSTTQLGNLVLWSSLGLAIAAPVAALLLALWRRGASLLAQVAALTAVGPVGVLLLVGAGRWDWSYADLYEADRYFFVLLLPLAVLAGAVAAAVADRVQGWTARQRAAFLALCVAAAGAEMALHHRALLHRVPFAVFAAHERRFDQLSDLAKRLEATASRLPPGSPPLSFPDGSLWFRDVHNGRISARTLLHVIGSGGPRLRLAPEPVGERDSRILNAVLAEWARATGDPKTAPVLVAGRLMNAQAADIVDFRADAQEQAVLSGFYPWEGTYRWMGKRGELRLTLARPALQLLLAAPIAELQAKKGWEAILVSVTAVDETTKAAVPLGTVRITQDGPSVYTVDPSPFLSRSPGGKAILVLEADRTWRPGEVLAGSQDQRDLSILVVTAGSAPP